MITKCGVLENGSQDYKTEIHNENQILEQKLRIYSNIPRNQIEID